MSSGESQPGQGLQVKRMGLDSKLRIAGQPWSKRLESSWGLDCPQTEEAWRHYCVCAKHMERFMWGSSPVCSVQWEYCTEVQDRVDALRRQPEPVVTTGMVIAGEC